MMSPFSKRVTSITPNACLVNVQNDTPQSTRPNISKQGHNIQAQKNPRVRVLMACCGVAYAAFLVAISWFVLMLKLAVHLSW